MVVYENLLFFTATGKAGGKDKIPKVRQKIHCLLFGIFKRPCRGVECQSGVTMSRKFLHNLSGSLTVRKERNVAITQAVKTYRITLSVLQFNFRYPQIFSDKLRRVNRLA